MALSAGSHLGPYRIEALLGAGGMGEVYKARDTRLDRTVAIKVLAPELAATPEMRDRFEREGRAVSSLDHPHICALYDIGHDNGTEFLVMQYLEGETLAARLSRTTPRSGAPPSDPATSTRLSSGRGPLAIDQVLRYAIQIADALDKAHRHGIVHRDLKPGNVMLTSSGARLLDFGLAKLRVQGPATVAGGASALATLSGPLTTEGAILGTLQYMSPEQLEGKDADARSDIFAFGAMLYEMLTGRRVFDGTSQASVIAAILDSDPIPLPEVPELKVRTGAWPLGPLDRLVGRCLAKNPSERWQCAGDLCAELQWIDEERRRGVPDVSPQPITAETRRARSRERLWMAAAAVLAIGAVTTSAFVFLRPAPESPVVRFSIAAPERHTLAPWPGLLAVSPDGRRVAVAVTGEGGQTLLAVRELAASSLRIIAGSEGASQPFWSPDSRQIGFSAGGKLKVVVADGGSARTLTEGFFGAWNSSGDILFSHKGVLHRIAASGTPPSAITALNVSHEDTEHLWPLFLPDGRRFLFNIKSRKPEHQGIYVASLDDPAPVRVLDVLSSMAYAEPGYLVFCRDGALVAQPFDHEKARPTGDPVTLVDVVDYNAANGRAAFSISGNGILAYVASGSGDRQETQLTWVDRTGKRLGVLGPPARWYGLLSLSPDGSQLVTERWDDQRNRDLWLLDVDRQVPSRFTFDPADEIAAVWSPDGKYIVFARNNGTAWEMRRKASGGAGTDELLFKGSAGMLYPYAWSPDGMWILFQQQGDIWALPNKPGATPEPITRTPFAEGLPKISPDGRWVAYRSDESGTGHIYVQPFPPTGAKWQISAAPAQRATWRSDGKELFYISSDYRLMTVDIRTEGDRLRPSAPRELFQVPEVRQAGSWFEVSRDGQRFLMALSARRQKDAQIDVVLNWPAAIAPRR